MPTTFRKASTRSISQWLTLLTLAAFMSILPIGKATAARNNEPEVTRQEETLLNEAAELAETSPADAANLLIDKTTEQSSAALDFAAGVYAAQSDQLRQAINSFSKAINKMPEFHRARFSLAEILVQQEQYAEAAENLQHLLSADYPRSTDFWELLAFTYEAQGNSSAAETAYRQILLRAPDSHNAKLGIIRVYAEQNRLSQAAHLLRDLLTRTPENAELWKALAQAHRENGETEKALVMLESARRLQLADTNTLATLGDLYFELDMPGNAAAIYQDEILSRPDIPVDRVLRAASALLHTQKPEQAHKLLTDLDSKSADLSAKQKQKRHLLLAQYYQTTDDMDEAVAHYRTVLDNNPLQGEALLRLSEVHLQEKRYAEAEPLLQRARRLEASRPRALVGLARIHVARKQYSRAEKLLQESLELEDNPQVASFLKQVAKITGE